MRPGTEAERQRARYTWYTPKEAGVLLGGISDEHVRQLISDGDLTALDVSRKQSQQKDYRISPEWVAAFLKRRTKNAHHAA